MSLRVSTDERDGYVIVTVTGDVDVTTAPRLRHVLQDLVAEVGRRVVVDLSEVGFFDSTGLSVLIAALQRTRVTGSSLALASAPRPIRRLLRTTGLDRLFTMHVSVEDALPDAGSGMSTG